MSVQRAVLIGNDTLFCSITAYVILVCLIRQWNIWLFHSDILNLIMHMHVKHNKWSCKTWNSLLNSVALIKICRVVNNTFKKYLQCQCQCTLQNVLPIPIPIQILKKGLQYQYFFGIAEAIATLWPFCLNINHAVSQHKEINIELLCKIQNRLWTDSLSLTC